MSSGELLVEREPPAHDPVENARSSWLRQIDELPPAPELPIRQAPNSADHSECHLVTLAASEWDALCHRADHHGLTPTGVLLAAYAEVIGRWCRRPAFTLGLTLPRSLRRHLDVDQFGDDVPPVTVLAVDQSRPESFADRATALDLHLVDDSDHQLASGVESVLDISRLQGNSPMPVVFTSTLGDSDQASGPSKPGWGNTQTPQTWINCHAMDRDGGLGVDWDVRAGVFPAGLVTDLVQAFHQLLVGLASSDDSWTSQCPVDIPAAQRAHRDQANATAAPLPQVLLHDRVCAQASGTPDRPALLWPAGSMSYGELLYRAQVVAAQLSEVRADDLVAVVMDPGWEQVAAVLGIGLAGAAYLPIDTTRSAVLRDQILADASVHEVLTQPWIDQTTTWPPQLRVTIVDRFDPIPVAVPSATRRVGQDDLAYVSYNVDSGGRPRGVMITHRAAVNTIEDITTRFGISAQDRVLGLANLGSDLSVYDIFGVLGAGGALVLPSQQRRADPAHWAELIAGQGVTLWNSGPAQLQRLGQYLDAVPAKGLSSLRLALLSGDWIPITLPGQLRKWLPRLQMISLGGAREAAIWSTYHPINGAAPDDRGIPYGRPLANQSCHVLDQAMRPRPDWVPGELYIGGTGVARGYLGDAEHTSKRFIVHPGTGQRLYRTGQRCRYLPGGVIEYLGREDSQVTIGGHCVEITEVESAIQAHPAVGSAAVVAGGRWAWDRRLVAFVEGARRPDASDDELDLRRVTIETGRRVPRTISHQQVLRFTAALNRAALVSMVGALRSFGLFRSRHDAHYTEEILSTVRVPPAQHVLIRRWLRVLVGEELLVERGDGRLQLTELLDSGSVARAWDSVETLRAEEICPADLVSYFRASAERLPALMIGAADPARMFFPEGKLRLAWALYADNALARYLNEVVAATVRRIAAVAPGGVPLRVLEVGAGAGATSAHVIPALSGRAVDYLFTDVSPFFLNEAATTFRHHPWVRFDLFDLNAAFRAQGLRPSSFDVIICTGALSIAMDVEGALSRMRELLVAHGWLVLVEPTREQYEIMTSQAFMTNWAQDQRRGEEVTFRSREQWLATLRSPADEVTLCLPAPADPLSRLGQHVFVTQVKRDTEPVKTAALIQHLATRLPQHMVPADIQIVDALPLDSSGNVDRAQLRSWLPETEGQFGGHSPWPI
ncbi:MAG: amino acid adenylation domain-containing protein [Pseudonocardiaceae bacterium]